MLTVNSMPRICDKGFLHNHRICSHAYSFVHLINPPVFSSFDNQQSIINNQKTFEKEYTTNIYNVKTEQQIFIENQIEWKIKLLNFNAPLFSYGVTVNIDPVIPKDIDFDPVTRVSNYNDLTAKRWKEQKDLKLPLLFVYINGTPVTILTNPKNTCQFFYFNDSDKNYLKISHSSVSSDMHLCLFDGHKSNFDVFENSKQHTQFRKTCFNKMKLYYAANVISDLSDQELEDYSHVLYKEMQVYPKNIFQILNIKNIYLFKDSTDVLGKYDGDLNFNLHEFITVNQKINSIHHEIFHAIEQKLNQTHNEDLAVIYSYMICDKNYLDNLILQNPSCQNKVDQVKNMLNQIDESFIYLIQQHSRVQNNTLFTTDISYKSREKIIEIAYQQEQNKIYQIPKQIKRHDSICFTGISGSGVSLAKQIFPHSDIGDVIAIVRNPIDICIRNYLKAKIDPYQTYTNWQTFYENIMLSGTTFIRYEDIVTHNQYIIKLKLNPWHIEMSNWMSIIDLNRIQYNAHEAQGLEIILNEFLNTKTCSYFKYDNLTLNL